MSTNRVLGISAYYHDSAAALVCDGEIVAAAQQERFSRKKHDPGFPYGAVNYCLEEGRLAAEELDAIVFYDDGIRTLDRALKNSLTVVPAGKDRFKDVSTSLLASKIWVENQVLAALGSLGRHGRLLASEHHMAHAASAFYPSPFDEAAILTIDGVGEWATTTIGAGHADRIELFREIDYPHSLGLLYSAFTYFCGFKVNSGEYKLMGLAPYGEPRYYERIRKELIDVKDDGSFRLDTSYFGYLDGRLMTNERFHDLFAGMPREPESRITRREMDIAASIQKLTEVVMLRLAREARRATGSRNLVMAGGVALNCVANGKIHAERVFDRMWIQPAAGDAGGALGAALLVSHALFGQPRTTSGNLDSQKGSYLGPAYSPEEVEAFLESRGYPYRRVTDRTERARLVAAALAEGHIVGFFSGRMEFGPRALGARSILGDPRRVEMQSVMNLKIKQRESFRPFAPAVLRERLSDYFDLDDDSPYMLLVAPVRTERQMHTVPTRKDESDDDMVPIINQLRSDIPAVTHIDYSARIQTVHAETHPEFYAVLRAFEDLTGCGVLVNTSFNVRGEPIVCSPLDAYRCFMRTKMDVLVIEHAVLRMTDQPAFEEKEDWRTEFALD